MRKSYKYILFDLDGTLTDPAEGITNSVKYALNRAGISGAERNELLKFIGPPLVDSFMAYYGFSAKDAETAVSVYREYFSVKGKFENVVYDGIPELLGRLRDEGRKLIVATSKPELFTNEILEHFELAKYFDYVAGATMDSSRSKKSDVIRYALQQVPEDDRDKVVMIGDRCFDMAGACENHIDAIGVLFGYGDEEELKSAGAGQVAGSVEELGELL